MDKLFLQRLQAVSKKNKEDKGRFILVTSQSNLSKELLDTFDINPSTQGIWLFDVYVKFEPAFREDKAEDWQ